MAEVSGARPKVRLRLLLVERDRPLARALGRLLRGSFEIEVAHDAAEALERADSGAFAVVLCESDDAPSVLAGLARVDPRLAGRVIRFGCRPPRRDDEPFLQKPFGLEDVEAAVSAVLRR